MPGLHFYCARLFSLEPEWFQECVLSDSHLRFTEETFRSEAMPCHASVLSRLVGQLLHYQEEASQHLAIRGQATNLETSAPSLRVSNGSASSGQETEG